MALLPFYEVVVATIKVVSSEINWLAVEEEIPVNLVISRKIQVLYVLCLMDLRVDVTAVFKIADFQLRNTVIMEVDSLQIIDIVYLRINRG